MGIKQLEIAAASGRYLRPFAKILLALRREKKPDVARNQLTELVAEFPQNPLFVGEPAKLNSISPENGVKPKSNNPHQNTIEDPRPRDLDIGDVFAGFVQY